MTIESDLLLEEAIFVGLQIAFAASDADVDTWLPAGAELIAATIRFADHSRSERLAKRDLAAAHAIQQFGRPQSAIAADSPETHACRQDAIGVADDRAELTTTVLREFPTLLPTRNRERNWRILLLHARGIRPGKIAAAVPNERGGVLGSAQAVESVIKRAVDALALRLASQIEIAISRWQAAPLRADARDLPQLAQLRI